MGFKNKTIGFAVLALMAFLLPSAPSRAAAEKEDSLVYLKKAKTLELITINGINYRKAIESTFLHNGTYLVSDTALWNVDGKIINAWGHVQVIQDETILTSENLDYLVDENLAQFRGGVVQLKNKQNNILRTSNLDYNTKDSIAVFRYGGAMIGEEGQVIESQHGEYNSSTRKFFFEVDVNMYTDTTFIRTDRLEYHSAESKAVFDYPIDFWNDGNMLSADKGWYDKTSEVFFFRDRVHGTSEKQEMWCDSMYVYRNPLTVDMYGKVQVQDTSRNTTAVAEYIHYDDTLSQIVLQERAAVEIIRSDEENHALDSLYFGADSIVYTAVRRCDIPESEIASSNERLTNIMADAVTEYRVKAAQAAAQAAAEAAAAAMKERGIPVPGAPAANSPQDTGGNTGENQGEVQAGEEEPDAEEEPEAGEDSLAVEQPDTTKFGFVYAKGNVKAFRRDIQLYCESMRYNDLDSIARFFDRPLIWNDVSRQYSADSVLVLVRDGRMDRANLSGEAFIVTYEKPGCYDQIKGSEVMAFFDENSELKRFDALGGASALFYLKEKDELATVNIVSAKMLSAELKDSQVEQVFYFEEPKNDAYPLAQLQEKDRQFKGFEWKPELRPASPLDISDIAKKESERERYASHKKTHFVQTDIYFPGHMKALYAELETRDSLRRAGHKPLPDSTAVGVLADSLSMAHLDSIAAAPFDSLVMELRDSSLMVPMEGEPAISSTDSLTVPDNPDADPAASDEAGMENIPDVSDVADTSATDQSVPAPDSLAADGAAGEPQLTALQKKMMEIQERAVAKQARLDSIQAIKDSLQAIRDSILQIKWARLDSIQAVKDSVKAAKRLEIKRKQTRKDIIARRREEARDSVILQRYINYYTRKKAREDARLARRKKTVVSETDNPANLSDEE